MRKRMISVLIVVAVFIFSGCTQSTYTRMLEQETPFLNLSPVYVYNVDNVFYVVVLEDNTVVKAVQFLPDRSAGNTVNIRLQQIDAIEAYLGMRIDEIQRIHGTYHANIGHGLSMPSYITKDGYLVSFTVIDGIVQHVGKTDLLSGEDVEWCDLHTGTSGT